MNKMNDTDYAVIGAGPAGICAIVKLISENIAPERIVWIDPEFKCGDFGTVLSEGNSVPGNTKVSSFLDVNHAMYSLYPSLFPDLINNESFKINYLDKDKPCFLKDAAEPMQYIVNQLQLDVPVIKGYVNHIYQQNDRLKIEVESAQQTFSILSRRVILAIGAKPKQLKLDLTNYNIKRINPNTAFIQSSLQHYIQSESTVKQVAVVGSSHSAALATMHLLQAGIPVIQFMKRPYKFAETVTLADGTVFTQFDNTGLKGEAAAFTKRLLAGHYPTAANWKAVAAFELEDYLPECTHLVETIGYEINNTLKINHKPITDYQYNKKTGQLLGVENVFGLGIAFPQEVCFPNGEIELAVGYSKFWSTVNDKQVFFNWKIEKEMVVC